MGKVADKLKELVNEQAPGFNLFLVDAVSGTTGLHRFYMDSQEPLDLKTLAEFSRTINKQIDEGDFGEKAFTVEISSPGADRPLTDLRQFAKHINKYMQVELVVGEEFFGQLISVNQELLTFHPLQKDKKNKFTPDINQTTEINFNNIKCATILILFN